MQETVEQVAGVGDINAQGECVAEKMSWASHRETTRIEDEAYCLMGIFGINMPLLYGEGEKALFRLQSEIWAQTGDESIFAWEHPAMRSIPLTSRYVPPLFDLLGGWKLGKNRICRVLLSTDLVFVFLVFLFETSRTRTICLFWRLSRPGSEVNWSGSMASHKVARERMVTVKDW
jgi:hypothetical protein